MYVQLPAETILTHQEEMAARTIQHHQGAQNSRAATPRGERILRRAGRTIAALGLCAAATTAVAISDATAHPARAGRSNHPSAAQLQQEIRALTAVGFVATSCQVDGTRMTNYRTNQSVLLSW